MAPNHVTPNVTSGHPKGVPVTAGTSPAAFQFAVCQQGAEAALKKRLLEPRGPFRLAFSRPGLLTLKQNLPTGKEYEGSAKASSEAGHAQDLAEHWLIRQSGYALGQLRGESTEKLADEVLELAGNHWQHLHVFQRDWFRPGKRGFEPGPTELGQAIREQLVRRLPQVADFQSPEEGAEILDLIIVEPNQWLVGWHRVHELSHTWPGGAYPIEPPADLVSRAYLKMAEGLAWSELPMQSGDSVVEIGSSPGGASQRLLDLGMQVTGVDPAEMDPRILKHPRFEHWRNKSSAIKRKGYSRFKWLTADANVAPNYTLDAVEDIVKYKTSAFAGLLLTFKLTDYALGEKMEEYLDRIRSWGFGRVRVRQLASNRKECCVAAAREAVNGG